MTARRPALSGSLATFAADEVLQWFAHHRGETLIAFRPAAESHCSAVLVHVRDGVVLSLKLVRPGTRVRRPARSRRAARIGRPSIPGTPGRDALALAPRAGALGSLLLERGALDAGELRAALGLQDLVAGTAEHRPLGRIVSELGFVDPGIVDDVLREQALRQLVALFQCRAGEFAVYPGCPEPPVVALGQRIDHLLLRVAHWIDQADPIRARV